MTSIGEWAFGACEINDSIKPISTFTAYVYADSKGEKYCKKYKIPYKLKNSHTKHTYGSYSITKAATVVSTGTKVRTCTVCGKKQTTKIAKLKATIKLSKSSISLKAKKSYVLEISKLANGDTVKSVKIDNKSIAAVKKVTASQYKITGKKKGTAKITITLKSGLKKTVTVTVK